MSTIERIQVKVPPMKSAKNNYPNLMLRPLNSTSLIRIDPINPIKACTLIDFQENVINMMKNKLQIKRCEYACMFMAKQRVSKTLEIFVFDKSKKAMYKDILKVLEQEDVNNMNIVTNLDNKWITSVREMLAMVTKSNICKYNATDDIELIQRTINQEAKEVTDEIMDIKPNVIHALQRARRLRAQYPNAPLVNEHVLFLEKVCELERYLKEEKTWLKDVEIRTNYIPELLTNEIDSLLVELSTKNTRKNYSEAIKFVTEYRNARNCIFDAIVCGRVHEIANDFSLHQI